MDIQSVIVGNKAYRDFETLQTPHEDARAIADILTTQYGFTTELILRGGSKRSLILLDRPAATSANCWMIWRRK